MKTEEEKLIERIRTIKGYLDSVEQRIREKRADIGILDVLAVAGRSIDRLKIAYLGGFFKKIQSQYKIKTIEGKNADEVIQRLLRICDRG